MSLTITESQSDELWPNSLRNSKWPGILALSATILIHLGIVLVLPDEIMRIGLADKEGKEISENQEYEISLIKPEEMRFVEANPEAPENEPDRTEQYSFRNQQSADESPTEDAKNLPKVEGEENSQKIAEGILDQSPPVEPGVFSTSTLQGEGEGDQGGKLENPSESTQMPIAQPLPAPEFIKQDPVTEKGPGSSNEIVGKASEVFEDPDPDAPIEVYRPQPNASDNSQIADGGGGSLEANPQPRTRPRLAPELLSGPLMRSEGSASRRGSIAIDATFSEFGEYEQQFYAAIQTGWYQEIEFFQPIDTASRVQVRLTIHSDGKVTDVKAVHTTASELATFICENAITKRSPFRPWTSEMVKVFGDQRTLNILFHYR